MRPLFRKLLFTICIIAATFVAQAQPASPSDINKELVAITDTLNKVAEGWNYILGLSYNSGKYGALKPAREYLQAYIEAKLTYVAAMKDINNSKPLRQAYIDFLNFQKKMVKEGFTLFETLPDGADPDELEKRIAKVTELSSQEATFITRVNEAHQRYAKENGFTIVGEQ